MSAAAPWRVPVLPWFTLLLLGGAGCGDTRGVTNISNVVGGLVVTNLTTGGAFDFDGVEVLVDGESVGTMHINDSLVVTDVRAGARAVEVRGVASNCGLLSETAQVASVPVAALARVEYGLHCYVPTDLAALEMIVVTRDRGDPRLVVISGDGTVLRELTTPGQLSFPDVSPDGTRLLYVRKSSEHDPVEAGLYVANVDGRDTRRITQAAVHEPRWSPDGKEIAFVLGRDLSSHGGLTVMKEDGSGEVWLDGLHEGGVAAPTWSADGRRIAYTRVDYDWWHEARIINRDGTGSLPLLRHDWRARWPVWSPVSDRVAVVTSTIGQVLTVMRPDGTQANELLSLPRGPELVPVDWSADDAWLVFTVGSRGFAHIGTVRLADGAVFRLTARPGMMDDPVFR